ncbi:hypothetical protein C7212DRAFT_341333 [Tuber magnatum]|uniref:Uncharacterized protein n=1 Tax=Tuber magnatum TaxID=42249 RepID=A0A317T5F1_9PEZI|nr:hypothetical protein C7212DRAFT_341333 [Tuber magnatum]
MSKSASGSAGTSPPVRGKTAKISVVRGLIGLKNEKYEWNKLVKSPNPFPSFLLPFFRGSNLCGRSTLWMSAWFSEGLHPPLLQMPSRARRCYYGRGKGEWVRRGGEFGGAQVDCGLLCHSYNRGVGARQTISAKAFQKFNQENGFARTPTWSTLSFAQQQSLIERVKEYANMTPGCAKYFEDHPWLPEYLLYQRTRNKNTARKKDQGPPGLSAGEAEEDEEEEVEDGNGSAKEDQGPDDEPGPADNQDTLSVFSPLTPPPLPSPPRNPDPLKN